MGIRAIREARINSVKGKTFATADKGHGRTVTGNKAPEKTISNPEMYVGRAHSNFVAKIVKALKRNPKPIQARMLTTRARSRRIAETGLALKGIPVFRIGPRMRNAPAREAMDVIAEVAKEARHLPARKGDEELGEMKTCVKTLDHFPSVIAKLGTQE